MVLGVLEWRNSADRYDTGERLSRGVAEHLYQGTLRIPTDC